MTHNMVAQKARVSEFLGLAVYDADDEQIGTVADIVMEKQSGKARLALISLREPAGDENDTRGVRRPSRVFRPYARQRGLFRRGGHGSLRH